MKTSDIIYTVSEFMEFKKRKDLRIENKKI